MPLCELVVVRHYGLLLSHDLSYMVSLISVK